MAGLFSRKIIKSVDVVVSNDDKLTPSNCTDIGFGTDAGTRSHPDSNDSRSIGIDTICHKSSNDDNSTGSTSIDNNSISSDSSRILSINGSQSTQKTAMMTVFESKDMVTSILRFI